MYFFFFDDAGLRSYLAPYTYRRRKPTTYGTFKKREIRFGTKGNYKIHDYNTHEFHNILRNCNIKDVCRGHILELTDYKDAVWAKLNFENLMNDNKGTKMLGLYGPVDLEPMREAHLEFNQAYVAHNKLGQMKYALDNLTKGMERFRKTNFTDAINQTLIDNSNSLFLQVQNNVSDICKSMHDETNKMVAAQDKIKKYLESIKLSGPME